jgi:hypothetical protein
MCSDGVLNHIAEDLKDSQVHGYCTLLNLRVSYYPSRMNKSAFQLHSQYINSYNIKLPILSCDIPVVLGT